MSHQQCTQIAMIKIKSTRYEKMCLCKFSDGEEREKGGSKCVRREACGFLQGQGPDLQVHSQAETGHKDEVRTEH